MTDLPDEQTRPARRRRSLEDATIPDAATDVSWTEGSTVIARRESRRRGSRRAAEASVPPTGPARAASGPDVAAIDPHSGRIAGPPPSSPSYGARAPEPVVAVRAAPPARVAQAPVDGRAAAVAHQRRARRTALIVVAAASGAVLAGAASLLVIILLP